ncbi:MAG TPA: TonB-dependent receptor [Bryobacteraceae bacterium]|nr:TonB-dependent receptor [Bryobacteraceae bacterium]
MKDRCVTSIAAAVFLAAILTILTASIFGQATFGNISGTVTDPAGAAVPNAQVTITDTERGETFRTSTNGSGNYSQTHLLAGQYKIVIAAPGFSDFNSVAVVQVDATTRADAQLQIGKASTEVVVTGEAPLLKSDRAEVSTTITGPELEKLPILDRNITSLLVSMPGAGRYATGAGVASAENQQADQGTPMNGQLPYSNGFNLDGTENHSNILGLAVVNPNPDALEEFKVTSSNYDAEFGNVSGAMLQGTTKSGTNQYHGSLFEYLRNDMFNAADPFTGINAPIRWNQFGGSLGGPVIKDKLFVFFAYEGSRKHINGAEITTVPTAAERSGDLSALLGDYICANGTTSPTGCANPVMVTTTEGQQVPAQAGMVFDPHTGNPDGSGREVEATNGRTNVLTPAAPMAKLLTYLPMPNFGAAGQAFNNYSTTVPQINDAGQYDGRVDYNISDKHHLFGRYSLADFILKGPGGFGAEAGGPTPLGFAGNSHARNQSLALGYTYSVTPTLIADFRFGFYRYRPHNLPNGYGTTPALDAGLLGLNTGTPDTSGMPAFYVNGDGGFNFGYSLGVDGCNCPLSETENHFQWVNNWTKQAGNHTIKWGADIRRAQQKRIDSSTHRAGEVNFTDSQTGNLGVDTAANGAATTGEGLGSFLLGVPGSFYQQNTGPGFYPSLRQTRLFFFGQDEWRVTPKLTLTFGLRYENYLPQTGTQPGSGATFDPSTGEAVVAGIGGVPRNMGIDAYNWGFAPRLGIAYQLTKKTVIRTGYGRSFNAAGVGAVFAQNPELDPPVQFVQNLNPPNPYGTSIKTFLTSGRPAPPAPPTNAGRYPLPDGIQIYFYFDSPDAYRIPLADFWNFSVQHQIAPTLTVEAAYVGNVGRHGFLNENTNQAIPGPGDYDPRRRFYPKYGLTQALYDVCNCDNSSYNSLQMKLQKRVSRGLDFLLTYTWSKAMDNGEGGYGFADNYNVRNDHGPATFDRTHAVTLLNNWDLPFGKGRKYLSNAGKAADAVAGGWRLSGVSTVYSGVAFTPTISNAPLVNADFNYFRPDIIGDPHVSNPSANLWFDPNAYTAPQQPYRNGDASKGSLRGPALYVFNLSLSKEFAIVENKTLEFRWENFNAFNHVNLGLPNNTVDVGGSGQITSTANPMRQMQLGLHFRF